MTYTPIPHQMNTAIASRRLSQRLKHIYRLALLASISLSLSFFSVSADARPRPKARKSVSEMLQKLSWGQGHETVIKHLQEIVRANYQERITAEGSAIRADRIRAEMARAVEAVKGQYMNFTGQRTGYAVSFLKNDFAHNNGESLLKFEENGRTRYYFFRYNQLWKIVISYPSTSGTSFKEFVGMVKESYGRPQKRQWETPNGGGRQLMSALWRDDKTELRLEDKTGFYGVYVMKLVARAQGAEIEQTHAARREPKREVGTPQRVDNSIDIFGEEDQVEGVVDQITGKQYNADLERVDNVPAEEEDVNVRSKN